MSEALTVDRSVQASGGLEVQGLFQEPSVKPGASGPALGNLGVEFRRVVRAASGLALGNLGVEFRRVVRAASGLALG
ncbi:MAG: hypothetical protein WBW10_14010, partial [Syntrophobacteraceae bacterium]